MNRVTRGVMLKMCWNLDRCNFEEGIYRYVNGLWKEGKVPFKTFCLFVYFKDDILLEGKYNGFAWIEI